MSTVCVSATTTRPSGALIKEFEYSNPMEVPRLTKIVVNIGLGEALTNSKAVEAAVGDMTIITGQKPIVTKAKRSIAQFKIREGNTIGVKVTLRGQRMWDFLERLTRVALPRIRDFRGVPTKSFDGRGNFSLGLREQLAFPEIDYDDIDRPAWPRADRRHHRQDRRGIPATAGTPRHALRELEERPSGQEVHDRQGEARAALRGALLPAAVSSAVDPAPTCAGSASAASASGSAP